MTDAIILLVIISYFILAWLVVKGVYNSVKSLHWFIRFVIFSFFCALFFGFDLVGGGGPHGFVLPVPVIFSVLYADPAGKFILLFLFWWTLILIIIVSIYLLKKLLADQKKVTN